MSAPVITTIAPADFANRQQKYFSRQLLVALQFNLRLGSYGVSKELPANSASATIRFFRPRRAKKGTATSGPRSLAFAANAGTSTVQGAYANEGVPITPQTGGANIGYVDIQLQQRGDLSSVSDITRAIDLFDTLAVNTKTMAADAALDFDGVCSRSICGKPGQADSDGTPSPIPIGATTLYASNSSFERFAGVVNTLNSQADWSNLAAGSTQSGKMTRLAHLGMVTRLRGIGGVPGVPMIGGKFKAIIAPEVMMDLRQDSVWLAAAVFNNSPKIGINQWEEFDLDGCSFVEAQNPFIESIAQAGDYGTYSPDVNGNLANNIYSNIYLGAEFFGVPKLSGMRAGSDPRAPSVIILDKADKSDPLNQQTTFGWKAFYQSGLLLTNEPTDLPHGGILRTRTTMV